MPKKQILITAATAMELDFLLARSAENEGFPVIENKTTQITPLVSGIGSALTAFSLSKILQHEKCDAAYQLGIAGSFKDDLLVGSIVKVNSDIFADLCLSDNGKPIHEATFSDFRTYPFTEGRLIPDLSAFKQIDLPEASAITVNSVTATSDKRELWLQRYNPGIETMEGAAFYYACMKENIPCVQIRAISNMVSSVSGKWKTRESIENLASFFLSLYKM